MKIFKLLALTILLVSVSSCKQESKKIEETTKEETPQLTILEKVADAHGFSNWKNIQEIAFTFNVDRNDNHFQRSWTWNTKTNDVSYLALEDSLQYNRKSMDSVAQKRNAGFINDKYWLLAPFNLVWDSKNFTYEHTEDAVAPISGNKMQKLTIVYGSEGGYTPGDAYDFYFGDDLVFQEWTFRKGNQEEPSMTTTWEAYKDTLGIKLATMHKTAEGDFSLYFDGLELNSK